MKLLKDFPDESNLYYKLGQLWEATPPTVSELLHNRTRVEVCSADEIYLLAEDECGFLRRQERICGVRRPGTRFRCCLPAGLGTAHVGVGRCYYHEAILFVDQERLPPSVRRILSNPEAKGLGFKIDETLQGYQDLVGDESITDLTAEIVIVERLLQEQINTGVVDQSSIESLIEVLIRAKSSMAKIRTDRLTINVEAIRLFIKQLLQIARQILDPVSYSKLCFAFQHESKFQITPSLQRMLRLGDDDLGDPLPRSMEVGASVRFRASDHMPAPGGDS